MLQYLVGNNDTKSGQEESVNITRMSRSRITDTSVRDVIR